MENRKVELDWQNTWRPIGLSVATDRHFICGQRCSPPRTPPAIGLRRRGAKWRDCWIWWCLLINALKAFVYIRKCYYERATRQPCSTKCAYPFNNRDPAAVHQLASKCKQFENRDRFTCTCTFCLWGRLSCCHVIFIALEVQRQTPLPTDIVNCRWRYDTAGLILDVLKKSNDENVRLLELLATPAKQMNDTEVRKSCFNNSRFDRKIVEFRKLKRGESRRKNVL